MICYDRRRTGIFLPGGALNHLPKKFLQVAAKFYETVERKRVSYDALTMAYIRYAKIDSN